MAQQPLFGCAGDDARLDFDSLFSADLFPTLADDENSLKADGGADNLMKMDFGNGSFQSTSASSSASSAASSSMAPAATLAAQEKALPSLDSLPNTKKRRTATKNEDPEERLQRSPERNKIHAKRSRMYGTRFSPGGMLLRSQLSSQLG